MLVQLPSYTIIEGNAQWADRYRLFCRQAWLSAYVKPELGITADNYSAELFSSKRVVTHFNDMFRIEDNHKVWLAVGIGNRLIGGVLAHKYPDYCEMKAFYVTPTLKGHGIGRALYDKVLAFAGSQPIQVDVVHYMKDTINLYRHWGFEIDKARGEIIYPWVEWSEPARYAGRGIYMVKPGEPL